VDVQFRLAHGPQVVGLFRAGQKSVDEELLQLIRIEYLRQCILKHTLCKRAVF
jgi:hypothetical protein